VDDIEGITVLGLNPLTLTRSSRVLKRFMDIVGAMVGLLLFSPVVAMVAVAVKLDHKGSVLFKQERIGRRGRPFRLLKFRTMVSGAERQVEELFEQSEDPHWLKLDHDPRVTRVGRVLRLTSLDELPQLWNVLSGDMSLVGPRPLIETEDAAVSGWARTRLDLAPGITGLWQVLGRTSIPFEEMVKLDYLYVTNWSLWLDVKLLLRTFPVVLHRRGAN
jgi:lipopolysaccharide/colanic/teichoic acid biosynthesis glycosyltransferase